MICFPSPPPLLFPSLPHLPFYPSSISVPLLVVVGSRIDEKTLKCEGVCTAFFPTCTTMAVVTHPGKLSLLSFCPSSPLPFSFCHCGIPSIVLSFLLPFFLPLPFSLLPSSSSLLPTSSLPPPLLPSLLPPDISSNLARCHSTLVTMQ